MNKKGFVTVFVCIFFTSLMILITAFISAGKQKAIDSSVTSLENLWIQSILAEYDLNMYNRYGLFGFYGYPEDIENKMMFYVNESFGEKKYISVDKCVCRLYEYSLKNTEISRNQIIETGKKLTVEAVIKDNKKKPERIVRAETGEVMGENAPDAFDELPSQGSTKSLTLDSVKTIAGNLNSSSDLIKSQTDRHFINRYADYYFKTAQSDKDLGNTYFSNEIEYLIAGKHSDDENQKAVRNLIIGMREVSNMKFLNTDSKRRAVLLSAAEAITPEIPMVTFEVLAAAWALAESVNDYNLLMEGYKVPIDKTDSTWATDIDQVLENISNPCIFSGTDAGQTYSDYLYLLTYSMDENVLILRMLDLIQLNMRQNYFDSFRIQNVNGGISVRLDVNGKSYEGYKTY